MIQAPQVKYARYGDGALAAIAAAITAGYAATELINAVAPLTDPLSAHLKFWTQGALRIVSGYETDGWRMYSHYLDQAAASGTPYIIKWRMYSVVFASAAAALAAGWWSGKPISDLDKVSGNDLLRDREAVRYFNSLSEQDGLRLANDLRLELNKETEHWLISGGTGAGKSVSATALLVPALERGDRVILINYKGLTEKFPVTLNTESKDYDAIILCPFDKRSVAWAIWKDVTTKSQARELSARIIPESKDPVWSNSARFLMTGILMYLINNYTKKSEAWSWKMFGDLCVADRETLVEILTEHYPEGLRAIKDEGKTSDSVMMNFAAFAAPIIDLADAWGDRKTGFSIEAWVNNPSSKIRTVILQISSEFKVLSQAFNQSILNQVGTYLTRMPDVKASQAPLWIYADEFPRLGKAEVFEELFAVGRSKSMRVMIAIQSLGQLKKEYGIDLAEGWIDSIGTKIMGRQDGVGAKWLSDMCGSAEYVQLQNGRLDPDGSGKIRNAYSAPQTFQVFPPQLAQNELGIVKQGWLSRFLKLRPKGVRMLIHGTRGADLIVNFPFPTLLTIRKETVLSEAFKGGFGKSENINIDEIMEAENLSDMIFGERSEQNAAALIDEFITQPTVFDTSETEFLEEHNQVSETVETEFMTYHEPQDTSPDMAYRESDTAETQKDELHDHASSEILDDLTDSNISLTFEMIDFVDEVSKPMPEPDTEVFKSVIAENKISQSKKRFVSRKALREMSLDK